MHISSTNDREPFLDKQKENEKDRQEDKCPDKWIQDITGTISQREKLQQIQHIKPTLKIVDRKHVAHIEQHQQQCSDIHISFKSSSA